MNYVSTRGAAPVLGFADVLTEGLATDGGLYVPESWPALEAELAESYAGAAVDIMWPFVEGSLSRPDFESLVDDAYSTFEPPPGSSPDVAPVSDLGDGVWLCELYWGPTLAFKDIALQLVGRLFDHQLTERGERVTIIGATSGDTGSAAIDAVAGRDHIDIFILHPAGRTSEVQRRQMTTVAADNVFNIAIEGTFDDCQDLVKALFGDEAFRRRHRVAAVNSINWARVMAQIVYYVTSAREVNRRCGRATDAPVDMAVPTGNFGNIFAGYGAARMGLDVGRFLVASNTNDILTRFFRTGRMSIREVVPTMSPSMDIVVSSNFERLLFELTGRQGAEVVELMDRFRATGEMAIDDDRMGWLSESFVADRLDDDECLEVIAHEYARHGRLLDPHSAVGVGVARREVTPERPVICMGTAHPAKFPDAVEAATGVRPSLPERLVDLLDREERYVTLPVDIERGVRVRGGPHPGRLRESMSR